MCQFCGHYPCDTRCPNAPEPSVVCECDICGTAIRDGDEMYVFGNEKICVDCVLDAKTYADVEEDYHE